MVYKRRGSKAEVHSNSDLLQETKTYIQINDLTLHVEKPEKENKGKN